MLRTLTKKQIITYAVIAVLAVGGGVYIGEKIKDALHYQALVENREAFSWAILDKGYQALKKDQGFVYGNTLKQLQSMNGQPMTLFGFMIPIESTETHQHFLFSPNSHSCPFCTPANAGNTVEVFSDAAITYQNVSFLLQGTFSIGEDAESDLIYKLTNAHIVEE